MKYIIKLFTMLTGWKSIIGWILLEAPWFTSKPMLIAAIKAALANPTNENISLAITQLILAIGIIDKVRRNVIELV